MRSTILDDSDRIAHHFGLVPTKHLVPTVQEMFGSRIIRSDSWKVCLAETDIKHLWIQSLLLAMSIIQTFHIENERHDTYFFDP